MTIGAIAFQLIFVTALAGFHLRKQIIRGVGACRRSAMAICTSDTGFFYMK
jgi:hypothetical protein